VKVEVLYVPDCPHRPAAVNQLEEILRAEGLPVEISEVLVKDARMAEKYRFRGSPTIRINGRDIAGEPQRSEWPALACRIYPGAREAGVPPAEMIQSAIREARAGEIGGKHSSGIFASLGAIASTLATLGCCLPLSFAAGLGAAGLSAFLQTFKPWLLGLAIVLIGVGFWQQRRAKQCAVKRNYLSTTLLWVAVVVVIGMVLFPQEIAGFIADRLPGAVK